MRGDVTVMDQEIMGYEWYIPRVRKLLTQVSFPPVLSQDPPSFFSTYAPQHDKPFINPKT